MNKKLKELKDYMLDFEMMIGNLDNCKEVWEIRDKNGECMASINKELKELKEEVAMLKAEMIKLINEL